MLSTLHAPCHFILPTTNSLRRELLPCQLHWVETARAMPWAHSCTGSHLDELPPLFLRDKACYWVFQPAKAGSAILPWGRGMRRGSNPVQLFSEACWTSASVASFKEHKCQKAVMFIFFPRSLPSQDHLLLASSGDSLSTEKLLPLLKEAHTGTRSGQLCGALQLHCTIYKWRRK